MHPEDSCLILLAGGKGTRVHRLYPGVPKLLIPVAGRPFIEWMLLYWAAQGVRRVIVSLGHLAEAAEAYFQSTRRHDLELLTVREDKPLGTGGAIRLAAGHPACSDPFIVANGDSLAFGDFPAAWSMMLQESIDGVVLGRPVPDASRYGSLQIDSAGRLLRFAEKRSGRGLINAGVYLLRKRLIERFPAHRPMSVEKQAFPVLLKEGLHFRVHVMKGDFLDMGTPQALQTASRFIESHRAELESGVVHSG